MICANLPRHRNTEEKLRASKLVPGISAHGCFTTWWSEPEDFDLFRDQVVVANVG